MKSAFINSLMALTLLCLFVNPLFAQPVLAEAGHPSQSFSPSALAQSVLSSAVKYTGIDLSDPAVYAGEEFRIFVGLENTGKKPEAHTIAVYRKDASAPEGKVLMSSKQLTLSAGQNTEVVFTLAPENLLIKGGTAPESFVFIVGGEEVEVDYIK